MARSEPRVAEGRPGRVDDMLGWLRRHAEDKVPRVGPRVLADLGRAGFLGLQVGLADGGCALSHGELVQVLQQLGAIDLSLGVTVAVHNCLGLRPLLQFGPRAVQERFLPPLVEGPQAAVYALAEPNAGSNLPAMRTRARRVDGGWRLRGVKDPVALASTAGLFTVLASASDGDGAPLGPIALLVPGDADGIVHERPVAALGLRGVHYNAVGFDGLFVPDAHVLLAPGEGMRVARDASAFAQFGLGTLCTGAIKRCGQMMVQAASGRDIATGRLLDNGVTCARLHDLACAAWSLDALAGTIATALDERNAMPVHACAAFKCAAAELLWEVADHLLQLCGSDGNLDASPAATLLRDARALRLMEGSSEVLCMQLGMAAAPASGAERFLAEAIHQPVLAEELGSTVAQIRTRAGATPSFAAAGAANQWLDWRIGELCTCAVLLGAAQQRVERGQGAEVLAAAAWARSRFNAVRRSIDAAQAESCLVPPPALLERRIGAFAEAIGTPGQAS
jgi:alkylation response protein AidB-like acyl-CoA dehydrogenase